MNTKVFTPVLLSLITALTLLVCGGCQEIEKRSYDVTVKNESDRPVTVWLTKTGPLYETNWKSPEDLAIETRSAGERIAGNVVRPGETQGVGPIEGKFAPHSTAVLRVYLGEHNFSDLLAMSKGSPDRRDYELTPMPGMNSFRIFNRDGMLLIEPSHGNTPAPEEEKK